MKIIKTDIPDVLIIEPDILPDDRGFFCETYHRSRYTQSGIDVEFVQDNLSYSVKGTLRGLHYQHPHSQAKLVQVLSGEIFDVAVDIRSGSPSFGKWVGIYLSSENRNQLYIPPGFAHGFCVLSDTALFAYKCSDFYAPDCEGGILWSDPDLAIDWPIKESLLSEKDGKFPCLKDVSSEYLPIIDRY